jgi:hypothetical protein
MSALPREALDRWHQPGLALKKHFRDGQAATMMPPSLRSWSSIVASSVGEMAIREWRQAALRRQAPVHRVTKFREP